MNGVNRAPMTTTLISLSSRLLPTTTTMPHTTAPVRIASCDNCAVHLFFIGFACTCAHRADGTLTLDLCLLDMCRFLEALITGAIVVAGESTEFDALSSASTPALRTRAVFDSLLHAFDENVLSTPHVCCC